MEMKAIYEQDWKAVPQFSVHVFAKYAVCDFTFFVVLDVHLQLMQIMLRNKMYFFFIELNV